MHHRNRLKTCVSEKARRLIGNIAGVVFLCLFPLSATFAFAGEGEPVEKQPQTAPPATEKFELLPIPRPKRLKPEEYAASANELLAIVTSDCPEQTRSQARSELRSLTGTGAFPKKVSAEVYQKLFEYDVQSGRCSVSVAMIAVEDYLVVGEKERAFACLESLIRLLEEGAVRFEAYIGRPLDTPEARAALVKDLQKRIDGLQQGPARSTRNSESIAKILSSSLGAINAPSGAPEPKKAEYDKARQAVKAREFTKAEEILLALGDREAAAASLAQEAFKAPNAIELYDKLIAKYPDTKQAELAFYQKAFVYRDQGDQTRYLAALKEYLSKYPDGLRKLDALNELAQAAERDGRHEDAISAREKLREAHREKKIVWALNVMTLEQAYRKKGDLDSVKRLLEDTIAQVEDPESQLYGLEEKSDSELSRYNYLEQLRKALAELNEETQQPAAK